MDMTIIPKKWSECETIIRSMCQNNRYLSPYSDFEFLSRIKDIPNVHNIKHFARCNFMCYEIQQNGEPIMVIPIYVDKKQRKLYLVGEFSSVGHLDFIYNDDLSEDDLLCGIGLLSEILGGGYELVLDRISEYSLTAKALNKAGYEITDKEICVKIDFEGYDSWYASLSKSCRQNIRTSYNRLNSDNCEMSFVMKVGEKPDKKLVKDNLMLFSARILDHTKLPGKLHMPMYLYKKYEPLTQALFASKDNIFASVYINGKPAASLNGVVAADGRAIITRLSIETGMGRYSPGGLLLNETIKETATEYDFIKSIDLSRGDEPYKYSYGGENHYNCSYSINL